jgi:drug/metabolite transporter (DMT)-like permease
MKKLCSEPFDYKFPACITVLHFATVWLVSVAYWVWSGDLSKCLPSSLGSMGLYAKRILPIAACLSLSIVLNNLALFYIGAGLNAIISAVTPVSTALLTWCFGNRLSMMSWAGVACVFTGSCVIDSSLLLGGGPLKSATIGLLLSLSAVFLRSCKVVIQDLLMNPDHYAQADAQRLPSEVDKKVLRVGPPALEPMHLWALQGPPCIFFACCCACYYESPALAWSSVTPQSGALVLCTCLSALVVNLLGMQFIKDSGANLMQIIGKLNCLVTLACSVAFMGEVLSSQMIAGASVVMVGIAIFEHGLRIKPSSDIKVPLKLWGKILNTSEQTRSA